MSKQYSNDGSLLCARYAFMPNKLRYCGGDKNTELYNYTSNFYQDPGLAGILQEFATMHPYLKMIAHENKIVNPYDQRVVEAYWIGNSLLKNIKTKKFFDHLIDIQQLKKKLKPKVFNQVVGILPQGALPHHSFHVINIPKRTGHYPVKHTIETMDKCRISWGRVSQVTRYKVQVTRKPLSLHDNLIEFGKNETKEYTWRIGEKGFVKNVKQGDWVSIHWDFVCDKLSAIQVQNLKYYTQLSINLANTKING